VAKDKQEEYDRFQQLKALARMKIEQGELPSSSNSVTSESGGGSRHLDPRCRLCEELIKPDDPLWHRILAETTAPAPPDRRKFFPELHARCFYIWQQVAEELDGRN
jgi:hypothetical protein